MRAADVLTNETYGPCKVACEDDVVERYGDRATIVRPGRVTGPGDTVGHGPLLGTTWRARRPGRTADEAGAAAATRSDSRDVGRLVVQLITDERSGAFNAVGPDTTIAELIETSADLSGTHGRASVQVPFDAVPPRFPLVDPETEWGERRRNPAKARAAGMPVTPLRQTVADVLTWDQARGEPDLGDRPAPDDEEALRS